MKNKSKRSVSTTFKIGAIALVFIIIAYQCGLFVHKAASLYIEGLRDRPDTVYIVREIIVEAPSEQSGSSGTKARPAQKAQQTQQVHKTDTIRRSAEHSSAVRQVRQRSRKVENFRFDPNTASIDDLMRLGFSEKQAAAIDNYRSKGGVFRRKSDFAKSFVVADSVYLRLEPYIDIPLIDINSADSAAFDRLPGIGGYFAAKMVEYRERIGGYSSPEQLLEIYNFGQERYEGLKDLITVGDRRDADGE